MKDLTILDHFERCEDEFVTLAFTRGQTNQFVYRVEVQNGDAHFYEHYNTLDGELNKRLAHDKFEEFFDKFSTPKVRV
jgi:capsule polysaccharide modification protein KpsS